MATRGALCRLLRRALVVAPLFAAAPPAAAGDVTLFVSRTTPTEVWATGYGAALTSTWFRVVQLEGEAARVPGEFEEDTLTSFTAGAFLAPQVGRVTPYGGFGFGLFRQSRGEQGDTGFVRVFAIGAKLSLGVLVLRGEWRRMTLSGEPLFPVDSRVAAGIGIGF